MRIILAHGPANSLAIILSPEQRSIPIYKPLTSLDTDVLQQYFSTYAREIADTTKNAALCLELDHTPRQYANLADVLSFESVAVKSSAGNFGNAAQDQETLIKQFLDDEQAWSNASLREKIIASAKRYGDLRGRAKLPAELIVNNISSFYMKLFGGVFVVAPEPRNKYVILEDKAQVLPKQRSVYHMQDVKLLPKLLEDELLDVNETYYRSELEHLKNKYDALLADAFFQLKPTLDFASLSTMQRKQRLGLYADQLPKVIFELEQFTTRLTSDTKLRSSDLSRDLILLLLHPHAKVKDQTHDVLWQFLCRVQVKRLEFMDIAQLYQKDTSYFFEVFQSWSSQRQQWAENYLKARGMI